MIFDNVTDSRNGSPYAIDARIAIKKPRQHNAVISSGFGMLIGACPGQRIVSRKPWLLPYQARSQPFVGHRHRIESNRFVYVGASLWNIPNTGHGVPCNRTVVQLSKPPETVNSGALNPLVWGGNCILYIYNFSSVINGIRASSGKLDRRWEDPTVVSIVNVKSKILIRTHIIFGSLIIHVD